MRLPDVAQGVKKAPNAVTRSELSWDLLAAQLANNVRNRSAAIAKFKRKPSRPASEPLRYRYKSVLPFFHIPCFGDGETYTLGPKKNSQLWFLHGFGRLTLPSLHVVRATLTDTRVTSPLNSPVKKTGLTKTRTAHLSRHQPSCFRRRSFIACFSTS